MTGSERNSRLVLGTVQLGMDYGVANKTGKPDGECAFKIIKAAWEGGICEFDTAQGYGDSEAVLGVVFGRLGISKKVRVVSKFDPRLDHLDQTLLCRAIDASLNKLQVPLLKGILLHNENLLDCWDQGLGDNLRALVALGKVGEIGVSVYSVDKALRALQIPDIKIIQLPANIFDQRFEQAGFFAEAQKGKKQIYIRSVFLQGLILMELADVPEHLAKVKKYLESVRNLCAQFNLTPRQMALGYISSQMPSAKIIFGVETAEQLAENIIAVNKSYPVQINDVIRKNFLGLPQEIINPTLWRNK